MTAFVFGCACAIVIGIALIRYQLAALGLGIMVAGLAGLVTLCAVAEIVGDRLVEAANTDLLYEVVASPITLIILGLATAAALMLLYMVDNGTR
jgi:hypothetical protein